MITYHPRRFVHFDVIEDGIYSFKIVYARECESSNNNQQIEIHLKVNRKWLIRDYIVFSEYAIWKVANLFAVIGIDYKRGCISEKELINKTGYLITKKKSINFGHIHLYMTI